MKGMRGELISERGCEMRVLAEVLRTAAGDSCVKRVKYITAQESTFAHFGCGRHKSQPEILSEDFGFERHKSQPQLSQQVREYKTLLIQHSVTGAEYKLLKWVSTHKAISCIH
jgi:hypothetical protein